MTNTRGTAIQREQPVEKHKDTLGWVTEPSSPASSIICLPPAGLNASLECQDSHNGLNLSPTMCMRVTI
jgi:hypothetical protein